MRVNVTGQPYDFVRPWQKKAPFSKRALGAVLPGGRVLVTADLVANQNYVELERAESGDKTAANVVVVDYEANLALLEPTDKKFLDGLTPLQLALDTVVGDRARGVAAGIHRRARPHRRARHDDPDDALSGGYRASFSPIASACRCSIAITATRCRWSRTTSSPRCSCVSISGRRWSTRSRRRSSRIS